MRIRLAALAVAAAAATNPADAGMSSDVEAELRPLLAKHGVPALAAALVTGEGLCACGSAGVRKLGESEAVTAEDQWHLGSNTKAMTATLAGLLIQDGLLAWDSRVAEIFPELATSFHPDVRGVTVRQLLAHRGGLRPNLDWGAIAKAGGCVTEQRLRAVREGLAEKPEAVPGARTLYSNLGYVIVGAIIERQAGKPWEEAVAERLFKPLGMSSAGFGGVGTPGKLDQPWGHGTTGAAVAGNGPEVDNPPVLGPAGRIHCTLADWSLFVADQLRGAQGRDGLLRAATYRALHAPAADGGMAQGWGVVERPWGGGTVLTHNGCNTMNFSVAWLAPLRDFAVLVCCNQGGEPADKACDAAAAALIGLHRRSEAARLAASAERAWAATRTRFYLAKTHLFYDYLTSYEAGRELAHLPTAEEVRRQSPNECGYGTGMEDCMISAGTLLSLLVDRYAVTQEEALRQQACEVFQGVKLCATAHGVTGFLARAVCAEDLKSVYPNSSRDQYTHAVHGLWLYAKSPLCAQESRAEAGQLVAAIADRMTRTVIAENDYDSLRADGSRDTRGISRMWNVMAHEAARLPMIYAAAWDLTGKAQYRELCQKYLAEAVRQSPHLNGREPTYAYLQMQASLELLEALEADPELKRQMRAAMADVSKRCEARALAAERAADALDLTLACTDWRTTEGVGSKGAYRKSWYCIRESGEAALAQLMDGATPFPEAQQRALAHMMKRLDYDRVSSCGIFALQAAYWKARRRGAMGE